MAGGVFIEYSGIRWSMFQLTSYVNMYVFALLGAFVFLGGWEWPFGRDVGWGYQLLLTLVKMSMFIVFYLWVRASFPRMRVDQLMAYAWKVLIPFALLQIFLNGLIIVYDLPARTSGSSLTSGARSVGARGAARTSRSRVRAAKAADRWCPTCERRGVWLMLGILKSMAMTAQAAFTRKPVTIQYPKSTARSRTATAPSPS